MKEQKEEEKKKKKKKRGTKQKPPSALCFVLPVSLSPLACLLNSGQNTCNLQLVAIVRAGADEEEKEEEEAIEEKVVYWRACVCYAWS